MGIKVALCEARHNEDQLTDQQAADWGTVATEDAGGPARGAQRSGREIHHGVSGRLDIDMRGEEMLTLLVRGGTNLTLKTGTHTTKIY